MHMLSGLALLLLNVKYKTWRQLSVTWPGVVYVVLFDGFFYILCKDMHPLPWVFNSKFMKPKTLRYYHLFFIMPLLLLLFLAKRPQSLSRKITYILNWAIVSSLIEIIGHKLNAISFYHGWRIRWSVLLYIKMYTFSQLILVKPWLTIIMSLLSTGFFVKKFNVPFSLLKYKRLTISNYFNRLF